MVFDSYHPRDEQKFNPNVQALIGQIYTLLQQVPIHSSRSLLDNAYPYYPNPLIGYQIFLPSFYNTKFLKCILVLGMNI